MITHLLFKGLNSFNICSIMFRKILSVIIAVLIFALVFLAVKFTKVEVPNFNRNLIMLAVVDILAFGFVMCKFGCPTEKRCEDKEPEKFESVGEENKEAGVKYEEDKNKNKTTKNDTKIEEKAEEAEETEETEETEEAEETEETEEAEKAEEAEKESK